MKHHRYPPDKRAYLEALQAEIDVTDADALPDHSARLDYLLMQVYLASEQQRAQAMESGVEDLERRLRELTRRVHDFALDNFRIPFHHDQVIEAAHREFAWEHVAPGQPA